jgi:hypothetical protein
VFLAEALTIGYTTIDRFVEAAKDFTVFGVRFMEVFFFVIKR